MGLEKDTQSLSIWQCLSDDITFHIFFNLSASSLVKVSQVCKAWHRVAFDEFLWKDLFYRRWKIERSIPMAPGKVSWLQEYKRLYYHTPAIESEVLRSHSDQVLHVSFAHNGKMFATCSKDGFIKVWNSSYPCSLKYKSDMRKFTWKYTQFSQFNQSDTLLLVSGVHFGNHTTNGEIMIFSLQGEFIMQSKMNNKPYDVFGTWYNDCYFLSGELFWTGHLTSCSALSLNKAYQEIESEHESVVMRLFRFHNENASSIRTITVANVLKDETGSPHKAAGMIPLEMEPGVSQGQDRELSVLQSTSSDKGQVQGMKESVKSSHSQKKVQSVQVYENGSLCTKLLELDDDDDDEAKGRLNGTIEYDEEYRQAESDKLDFCKDSSSALRRIKEKVLSSKTLCSSDNSESLSSLNNTYLRDRSRNVSPVSMESSDNGEMQAECSSSNSASRFLCPSTSAPDDRMMPRSGSDSEGVVINLSYNVETGQFFLSNEGQTSHSPWCFNEWQLRRPDHDSKEHSSNEVDPNLRGRHLADQTVVSEVDMLSIPSDMDVQRSALSSLNSQDLSSFTESCSDLTWDTNHGIGSSHDVSVTFELAEPTSDEHMQQDSTTMTVASKVDSQSEASASSGSSVLPSAENQPSTNVLPDKYLIFTRGSKTYTPHQIGIKLIRAQDCFHSTKGHLLPDVPDNLHAMDREHDDAIDHIIDMHGHIIGLCLSPDHRYLYVNSRPWPKGYHIENPLYPPPIAQEIDIHIIDLLHIREVGKMHRSHKAYTSNDECFFIFLDVCEELVASGAEDKHGYLWDRHYGICLNKFPHSDVVNAVAFNPSDPEMLVTVSDDFSIKIWRSLNKEKKLRKTRLELCTKQETNLHENVAAVKPPLQ
ncbi:hypothetical protein ACJMK2_038365 [Sinanodonta woodiana]|uniref:F-box domain-containing protein n=1 Tax=Sinanodonta woodiana TaxID=1069815 RepID=A0ABD3W8R9_SINWO